MLMINRVAKWGGYTIIETLIFLAVTSGLFIIAVSFMNGKQSRVQFDQAVRDFDSNLQDVINDTATGYYPNNSVTCVSVDNTDTPPTFLPAGGPVVQGINGGCIFLGKSIQFGMAGVDCDSVAREGCTNLGIYTLVGRSGFYDIAASKSRSVQNLEEARVASSTLLMDNYITQWGLFVTRVYTELPAVKDYGQLAFVSSFASGQGRGDINTQALSLIGVHSLSTGTGVSAIGDNAANAVAKINDNGVRTVDILTDPAYICLSDSVGLAGRKAKITLNENRNVNTTRLDIDNVTGC